MDRPFLLWQGLPFLVSSGRSIVSEAHQITCWEIIFPLTSWTVFLRISVVESQVVGRLFRRQTRSLVEGRHIPPIICSLFARVTPSVIVERDLKYCSTVICNAIKGDIIRGGRWETISLEIKKIRFKSRFKLLVTFFICGFDYWTLQDLKMVRFHIRLIFILYIEFMRGRPLLSFLTPFLPTHLEDILATPIYNKVKTWYFPIKKLSK